jgi:hypothetical protein
LILFSVAVFITMEILNVKSLCQSYSRLSNSLIKFTFLIWEPGELSGIALGYGLDDRGFESQQRLGIFLFTTASRLALGPTQPPIQWVPGCLSLGVKRPGREADHSPISSADVKECLHGVVRS